MVAQEVVVIGAGVSGLTTAVRLAEAEVRVRVVAARRPSQTTSALAGASWGPYMVDDARVVGWSSATLREFERITAEGECGVRFVRGMEASVDDVDPPDWATALSDYQLCDSSELPDGFVVGWWHTIPLIDMPVYLRYLTGRLEALGVTVTELARPLRNFAEVQEPGVLINCTGLGARDLIKDPDLQATRGQLVVVDNPGIDWFFQDSADHGDLTYFLPHGDHVVLGGIAVGHPDDSVELRRDPDVERAIIERCAAIEPRLAGAAVRGGRVGLRPNRVSGVRVEVDRSGDRTVIHNYGHSGCGVTLSWGCADEVVALLAGL
ncbi:FAD-dependent oxidoreductase [Catellatospora chokoriensis]|uniref:D-amino-acid oxidase n=1 Tax=Catellatospora chokoriensis TaxID=310353 RepID=A0A8J3JXB5_9ACTN|nr:FAD-dependent oxidoreductase [Catellatospora chokoriensis]GIF88613.1 amino acid oxidase [Catellatospora chokoriensis]